MVSRVRLRLQPIGWLSTAAPRFGVIIILLGSAAACGEDETALRMKVGQGACDADSPALLGRVTNVGLVRDGVSAPLLYVVERNQHRLTISPPKLAFAGDCVGKNGPQRETDISN